MSEVLLRGASNECRQHVFQKELEKKISICLVTILAYLQLRLKHFTNLWVYQWCIDRTWAYSSASELFCFFFSQEKKKKKQQKKKKKKRKKEIATLWIVYSIYDLSKYYERTYRRLGWMASTMEESFDISKLMEVIGGSFHFFAIILVFWTI